MVTTPPLVGLQGEIIYCTGDQMMKQADYPWFRHSNDSLSTADGGIDVMPTTLSILLIRYWHTVVFISTGTANGGIDDTLVLLSTADKVLMTH